MVPGVKYGDLAEHYNLEVDGWLCPECGTKWGPWNILSEQVQFQCMCKDKIWIKRADNEWQNIGRL
jgi:hypothetical protein